MGIRDENPVAASDLDLIITSFEKALTQSRDTDSVLVPFRRQLPALGNYAKSVSNTIDGVPLQSEIEQAGVSRQGLDSSVVAGVSSSPELASGNPLTPVEDVNEEDLDPKDKLKAWTAKCVPCSAEFERTISSMNADFFKEIGGEWDKTLNDVKNKLKGFEDLMFGSDEDVLAAFCDIGKSLMDQCGPDLEKMLFVLTSMLGRIELEFSLDLSIIDSFLMAALSPIINELAANLDLIGDLALTPIKCVLNYLQYQVNNSQKLADEARAAVLGPVHRKAYYDRQRINAALRANLLEQRSGTSKKTEAELAAERSKLQKDYEDLISKKDKKKPSAIEKANQVAQQTKDSVDFMDKLKGYLKHGTDYLEDKKDWLLNLIEELVNRDLDSFDQNMGYGKSKLELLNLISILSALISAIKSGDISCGSDSDGMTKENIRKIVRHLQHPSESLEIAIEGDNIVARRRPEEAGKGSPDSTSDGASRNLENVVVRRPISSCLKKITTDEAEQVDHWIRQLEQEV